MRRPDQSPSHPTHDRSGRALPAAAGLLQIVALVGGLALTACTPAERPPAEEPAATPAAGEPAQAESTITSEGFEGGDTGKFRPSGEISDETVDDSGAGDG